MSKKKFKHRIHDLKLLNGHFYNVHDGSPGGHPGKIFATDYINDEYKSFLFGSNSKNRKRKLKGYIKLKKPIANNVEESVVFKRPFVGVRDDFGDIEYPDMKIDQLDLPTLEKIKHNNPRYGKYYKKKHK